MQYEVVSCFDTGDEVLDTEVVELGSELSSLVSSMRKRCALFATIE